MTRPSRVKQAIVWVEQQLEQAQVALGQGTLSHYDEAAWLVLWAVGLPLDASDAELDHPLENDQWVSIENALHRRIEHRLPMAYITGEAWLQGVPFHVDRRTIIPRSLIAEVLVHGALDPYVPRTQAQVLDLCTGNGSLAVLCAMAWPQAHLDALDLSADALAVAALNVKRHGLQERIRLVNSDGLQNAMGPYDLVVCNPPYVNSLSMDGLPAEFRHEPAMALAGGADGMDFVRPLLTRVTDHLKPEGALVLEIGHEYKHFAQRFPRLPGHWLTTSAGDEQVVLIERADLLRMQS